MFKNFLSLYGAFRLLDDLNNHSSGSPDNGDLWGCGCAGILALILLIAIVCTSL